MRTWTRAETLTICGGPCRYWIAKGEPMQLVTIPGVRAVLKRCHVCADGQPPADLPSLTAQAKPAVLSHVSDALETLRREQVDVKQRQAGERDDDPQDAA